MRRRNGIGRSLGRVERERVWQEKGGRRCRGCDIFLELTRGSTTAARFQISGYHVPRWKPLMDSSVRRSHGWETRNVVVGLIGRFQS